MAGTFGTPESISPSSAELLIDIEAVHRVGIEKFFHGQLGHRHHEDRSGRKSNDPSAQLAAFRHNNVYC
jgi:hypothetical protein